MRPRRRHLSRGQGCECAMLTSAYHTPDTSSSPPRWPSEWHSGPRGVHRSDAHLWNPPEVPTSMARLFADRFTGCCRWHGIGSDWSDCPFGPT